MNLLMPVERAKSLETGQFVKVINGPLAGVRGTLIQVMDDGTARIMLGMPEQGVFVVVDAINIASIP